MRVQLELGVGGGEGDVMKECYQLVGFQNPTLKETQVQVTVHTIQSISITGAVQLHADIHSTEKKIVLGSSQLHIT